jgi:SAM-dependent methyltransferase
LIDWLYEPSIRFLFNRGSDKPIRLWENASTMYHQLAHLYDWSGALDFAEKMLGRDTALLEANQIVPPSRILDLACGTGTLSLALAKRGYEVIGIDISEEMLTLAREKQDNASLTLQWHRDDMRYFLLDEPVDVVLCHYDSLNHLSNESELRAAFLQVSQALKPGGLFVFDLNTLDNYQTFWDGSDVYEGPNYRLKTLARFDHNLAKAEVEFQVQEYNDEGELFFREEVVQEHYFNETAVEKYLMAADFYEVQWEHFNPVEDISSDVPLKTFWHCKKRPL